MVLTSVSPISTNRIEEIDNSTYNISATPPDNPEVGDLWFDTTLDEMNIYNGYVWQSLVPTVSGADYKNHVAKHYWSGVDPIYVSELSPDVRIANEFATSGSGTPTDPYIDGIQEAINDLPNTGGDVFMPGGYYLIDEPINITKNATHLFGAGTGNPPTTNVYGTVIKLADGSNCDMIRFDVGATRKIVSILLEDFSLWGNRVGQSSTGHGIFINSQFVNCLLRNLYINEMYGSGITNVGALNEHIYASTFQHIYLEENLECGVKLYHFGDSMLQSVWAYTNTVNGIYMLSSAHSTLDRIGAPNNNNGIVIDACSDIQVRSCNARSNTQIGIQITGANAKNNIIDSCYLYDNQWNVWFYAGEDNKIVDSHISTATTIGIYVGGNEDNLKIRGNVIQTGSKGIDLSSVDIDNALISENTFRNNPTAVISDSGTNTTIIDNYGFITENWGSTTITNGNTHVTVTHEMDVTPTSITVTGNHSEVSACWIVNITSTQFEIWVSSGVTYDRVVYWYAEAR
jgi:parallel beta-helix repeat protein